MKPKNRVIIRALKKSNGHLGVTASELGVTYVTLWGWIKDDTELQIAKKEEKHKRVGIAVDALMSKIKDGDTTAIIFFLKTQCKDEVDEDFSERKALGNIQVIAQNAQINNNQSLKNLSTEQLRELRNLLELAKPDDKEEAIDVHSKQISD